MSKMRAKEDAMSKKKKPMRPKTRPTTAPMTSMRPPPRPDSMPMMKAGGMTKRAKKMRGGGMATKGIKKK